MVTQASACGSLFLLPAATSASQQKRAEFEVSSVKPNNSGTNLVMIGPPVGGRFSATNVPAKTLVALADDVPKFAISGGPGWMETAGFDIDAKTSDMRATMDGISPMLRSLLEDRFQLKVRRETKETSIYVITLPKGTSKLPEPGKGTCTDTPSAPTPGRRSGGVSGPPPSSQCGGVYWTPSHLDAARISMNELARELTSIVGIPVIDKSGFTGRFDVRLEFRSEDATSSQIPTIFVALEEQLGIRLESQKGPGNLLYIDHVEKPSEN